MAKKCNSKHPIGKIILSHLGNKGITRFFGVNTIKNHDFRDFPAFLPIYLVIDVSDDRDFSPL